MHALRCSTFFALLLLIGVNSQFRLECPFETQGQSLDPPSLTRVPTGSGLTLRVLNYLGGPSSRSSTFVYMGSSHQRKSAACPKFDMVWLNRSPMTVGRRGVIFFVPMRSSLVRMRSSLVRMRSSLARIRSSLVRMRSSLARMRSSIRRHSGIWRAADEAVLNIIQTKRKKSPKNIKKKKKIFFVQMISTWLPSHRGRVGGGRHPVV
jgi:hypothetical protein